MLNITLRILLILASVSTFFFVISKIRKAQLEIADAIIWILLSILLVLMSIFADYIGLIAIRLGFMSAANFIYTFIVFILIIITFTQSVKISLLSEKIKNLNHYIALKEKREGKK